MKMSAYQKAVAILDNAATKAVYNQNTQKPMSAQRIAEIKREAEITLQRNRLILAVGVIELVQEIQRLKQLLGE